jgi:hypothetical protein
MFTDLFDVCTELSLGFVKVYQKAKINSTMLFSCCESASFVIQTDATTKMTGLQMIPYAL